LTKASFWALSTVFLQIIGNEMFPGSV